MDSVFEKELWMLDISNHAYDCERLNENYKESQACSYWAGRGPYPKQLCTQHMTDSQWGEVIETAMEERCQKETDKMIEKAAKIG